MNIDSEQLIGKSIGGYKLRRILGKGGMGTVYEADDINLDRRVALKVMLTAVAANPEHLERFKREASVIARLEHPYIVPIINYETTKEMTYVVMRLLKGGTLTDRIERYINTPLRSYIEEVVLIIQQVAQALDYAHRNNVIHRDIKPSNIMFGADNNAVLVDFGVAKLMDATSEFTAEGVLVGTYYYMAPENWESSVITPAVDQYALGIILYQILAGRLPFEDTSLGKLMRQHSEEMPPPIHTIREGVPREISKVINRALAKKPDERFPTVSDFAREFAEKAQPLLRARQIFSIADQTETTPLPQQARSSMTSQAHIDTNIVPQQAHRPIATLTVERSGDKEKVGKTFRINQFPYKIGRGKTPHELNFDADRNVSRLHAKITYDADRGFLIQDMESTHGTTLSDKLIAPKVPTPLRNNTKIVLGKTTVLLFHTIDPEDTDYDRT